MHSTMLLQEKAAKELLEFNNRREGPILEGDQNFFFKLVEDIPQNNLSNWSVGTPLLRNKSAKIMLTKATNAKIINKSHQHKDIFLNAINNLNLIYLYWSNRFQDKNNYFFDYDLDNTLLALFNKKNTIKLNVYNLLMQSTNSQHALSASNRKFYWNSIENFYEPINYDANPEIDKENPSTTSAIYRLPMLEYFSDSSELLEKKLNTINVKSLHSQMLLSGLDLSIDEIRKKVEKIKINLKILISKYTNASNEDEIALNQYKPIDNILGTFHKTLNDIAPNTYLIKYNSKKNNFQRCQIFLKDCENFNFSKADLADLLEGELKVKNTNYQYLGNNLNLNNLNNSKKFNQLDLEETTIFFENGIEIQHDIENKILNINQKKAGSRTFIINGKLENLDINFNGFKIFEDNDYDLKLFPPNIPIDNNNLTGCLSLINLNVKNLNINASKSSCEDTVNLINVDGDINNITIYDSFSDALDLDFSRLKINKINILNARNDCSDFSSGKYEIKLLNVKNCGDKGVSIGEKSLFELKDLIVSSANIGFASKDSSISKIKFAKISNVKTCLSAYNKKPEFFGSFIEINKINCKDFFEMVEVDDLSKILLGDTSLNNANYPSSYNLSSVKIDYSKKDYIRDFKTFNKDETINAVIEIPKGTKEKWKVSKFDGFLYKEFHMGSPSSINFEIPYPVNYGMIPRTLMPTSKGGDGNTLDVLILGTPLNKGEIVKVKPLGVMKIKDSGVNNDKIIAVLDNSDLERFNNINHLKAEKPEILKDIKFWFTNYKGKNFIEFINFDSANKAFELVKTTSAYYKKDRIKRRD